MSSAAVPVSFVTADSAPAAEQAASTVDPSLLTGVWAMLPSIPTIVIIKVVSQHVAQLHTVAELLGD